MYSDIVEGVSENIKIMGWPFYAEDIEAEEPYNRRDHNFNSILNGTEVVTPGKYVHREFSFRTTIYFPTGRPDSYDKIFEEMMSKPVEVISPYMGGKFNALVTIRKTNPDSSPNHMDLDVSIVEVPELNSKIPGESKFIVPSVKTVTNTNNNSKVDSNLNNQLSKCVVPFKQNQKNNCVKLLQEKLISLGYLDKKFKTTVYDNQTINAVKKFQKSNGKLLVDGVFGKYTLSYLIKA